jgi:hypothetical protein
MTRDYSDLPAVFAGCVNFNFDSLLKSPAQLGAFLAVCKIIKDIEPEARTAAVNLALSGRDIPGFTLVRHETPGYVEAATLIQLLGNCRISQLPELLTQIAKLIGNISSDRYRALCAAIGLVPDEAAINQAGANPFLRQNQK